MISRKTKVKERGPKSLGEGSSSDSTERKREKPHVLGKNGDQVKKKKERPTAKKIR